MSQTDHELLEQFTRQGSQEAFTELVKRHLNLVYSAALRQLRSPHLSEEVCQSVFIELASSASRLSANTIVSAWLYQVTHHKAVDVVRREARRQAREQIAYQMSEINQTDNQWALIEPMIDEAMQALDQTDRAAILLRYFENKSLREVGLALGASEDAAQKRLGRAVERMRVFLAKRKIEVGTASLAALLSANAIQAAPAELAAGIATLAGAVSTAQTAATAVTLTKVVAMSTLQKAIVTAVATLALAGGIYQAREISGLRNQVQAFGQIQEQRDALSNEVRQLKRERDLATNALAGLSKQNAPGQQNPNEVLKLRGEVGRLRRENTEFGSSSPLSKVTASPEARKLLHDQQRMGMGLIYRGLSQQLKLTTDQTDKLHDLLADHIMENVGHVTTALRDKLPPEQLDALFASEDAALQEQIKSLLGEDGLAKYQNYTRNLLGSLSSDQFQEQLAGTQEEKTAKSKLFRQAMEVETQAAVASAGLPADYQVLPILNFRNIASEQEADRSLKLVEDIYGRVAARGSGFLSPEDLAKFKDFTALAINNSRAALALNRTMMAPLAKN